jgi:uncharacterized protein YutE (UPF0331/DUF86 family)
MIDDVVLNKKESVERCIAQIRAYYAEPSETAFADDRLRQDAIAINLQRGIEQCLDLANHAVRVLRLGIPKKSSDVFGMLADQGTIDRPLEKRLVSMVGFRNVLVHEYQKLEISIMIDVIENRLDDMIAFTNAVMRTG